MREEFAQDSLTTSVICRRSFLAKSVAAACGMVLGDLCRSWGSEAPSRTYRLAPESLLPDDIRRAPGEVREAYRFAIANRDTLRYIPCYCGCVDEGHTSNASCYVKDGSKPGNLIFDRMSLN